MSYIGSSSAVIPVGFSGVNSQSFNGDGSTVAFTLNRPVSAAKDVEVVVNNVQQSPYDSSYSVSGTTLTFSAAPSSGTANIYVTYRDQPVGSITDTGAVQKTGDTMTGNLIVDANVGIGTSSPTDKLTVSNGGIVVNGGNVKVTDGSTAFQMGVNNFTTGYGMGTTSSTPLIFAANGTERLRILASGGITFNGDTAAANALDDYEEGTWTPTLGGNTTYYTQTARYTKIGNLVYIWVNLHINVLGTGSQNRVSGLPFTPQQSNQHFGVGYFNGISQNLVSFYFSCSSLPALDPRGQTSAASGDVAVNVFQNGCQILFSGTYRVD